MSPISHKTASRQARRRGAARKSLWATSNHQVAQLERLILLFHRRWAVPILSELLRGDSVKGGAKFITLVNRLQISRDSLKSTLDYLIHHDLVMRNPGYGHPMRPEYILAEAGYDIAPACRQTMLVLNQLKAFDTGSRKWAMPAIYAIAAGETRFGQLKTVLNPITSRALTMTLKDLIDSGLIDRRISHDYPPQSRYTLTKSGRRVFSHLQAL